MTSNKDYGPIHSGEIWWILATPRGKNCVLECPFWNRISLFKESNGECRFNALKSWLDDVLESVESV